MPTWGQLTQELQRLPVSPDSSISPMDILRRKYLKDLEAHTGRATIVYATSWLENDNQVGQGVTVNLGDVHGFMEACSNLQGSSLDLIISSPGGSPDAAESIMAYLRSRFSDIRVIVPVAAMSAATMMSLAANSIVMAAHSQLGPIDPQFTINTPEGPRSAPGQAIIDQFEQAKLECQDPANIGAWLPLLRGLVPGLIAQCQAARQASEQYAKASLEAYMFAGDPSATDKALAASAWFADFTSFKSHGRRVSRDDARGQGLTVIDLESDPVMQDLVLSVYHSCRLTFNNSGAFKIVENHLGRAYIESMHTMVIPEGAGAPPGGPSPALPGTPNRQQRREEARRKK